MTLPVAEGSRLLLRLLSAPDPPPRSVVHGPLTAPAPRPIALAEAVADGRPVAVLTGIPDQAKPWRRPRPRRRQLVSADSR